MESADVFQTFTWIGDIFELPKITVVFAIKLFNIFTRENGLENVSQDDIVFYIFASIVIATKYLEDTDWMICADYIRHAIQIDFKEEIPGRDMGHLLEAEKKILDVVKWDLGRVEKVM